MITSDEPNFPETPTASSTTITIGVKVGIGVSTAGALTKLPHALSVTPVSAQLAARNIYRNECSMPCKVCVLIE